MTDQMPSSKNWDFLKIFNYLGSALIFLGIVVFIGLNWSSLNDFAKIFSTLGTAIAAYLMGVLLRMTQKYDVASSSFFLISGLVLPIGLYVTLHIMGYVTQIDKVNIFVSAFCFTVFFLTQLMFHRTVLVLFSVIFATFLFLSVTSYLIHQSNILFQNMMEYQLITIGLGYIFLGRYIDLQKRYSLVGPLYFFGAFFVLFASYSLSGFFFFDKVIWFWKIITAILIFSAFIFSVLLHSKSFLYLGAIFLVIYVTDMSSRFAILFGDVGWPLILIFLGFLLMVVGYLVVNLHKKIASKL